MDRLAELQAKLAKAEELSLEELKELDAALIEVFNEIKDGKIEGVEADDLELLSELHTGAQQVRELASKAQADEDEKQAKIEELASTMTPQLSDKSKDDEDEKDDEDAKDDDEAKPAEPEAPAEEKNVEVNLSTEKEEEVPEKPKALPALAAAAAKVKKTAAATSAPATTRSRSLNLFDTNGQEMSIGDLSENIIERRSRMGNVQEGVHEQITIGRFEMDIPEERQLNSQMSLEQTDEKVSAVIADAMKPEAWNDEALVAAGGWCAPLDTRYEIETVAGAHRPVRDALPRFGASRGGLRFRRGLSLANAVTAGGVGIWTAATDETPASNTKDVGIIDCDAIVETELDAIYRQLQFGNLRGRADGEGVAAWLSIIAASWARTAEVHLLDAIAASATNVSTDQKIGLARDFLQQVARAAAAYRHRHRMPRETRLRVLLPEWIVDAIQADLTLGQQSDPQFLGITEQQIIAWLSVRGVNASFYVDSVTGASNNFDLTQGANDLNGWPATAKWFMFHEGAFLFLDGGTLDLGVVRDSTLNGTNDYQLFAETFEQVAFVGVEAIEVNTGVCVNGTAAAPKDISASCIS